MNQIEMFRKGAVCKECGSGRVRIAVWVRDINEQPLHYVGEANDGQKPIIYCDDCRKRVTVVSGEVVVDEKQLKWSW